MYVTVTCFCFSKVFHYWEIWHRSYLNKTFTRRLCETFKSNDKIVPVCAMKAYVGVEVELHVFLTSVLNGDLLYARRKSPSTY